MTIINIEQMKKLDIEFVVIVSSFKKKHKLTDAEIMLLIRILERVIILKSFKEIILYSCEKLIDDKNGNN